MDALVDALLKGGHVWGAVALGVFIYVSRWLAGRIDKVIDRHVAFLDDTEKNVAASALNEKTVADSLARIEQTQKEHMNICRVAPQGAGPH